LPLDLHSITFKMAPFITLHLRFPTSVRIEKKASLPALLDAVNAAQQQGTALFAALLGAVDDAAQQLETQLVLANDPGVVRPRHYEGEELAQYFHFGSNGPEILPLYAKDPYETEDEYNRESKYSGKETHAAFALLDLPVDRRSAFPAQGLVEDYRRVLELHAPTPPKISAEENRQRAQQQYSFKLSNDLEVETSMPSRTLSPEDSTSRGAVETDNWLPYSTDHKKGVAIKEATVLPLDLKYKPGRGLLSEELGRLIPPEQVRNVLRHGVETAAWTIAQLEFGDPWEKKDYWAQEAEKRLRAKQAKERRNDAKQLPGARVHVDEMHDREQENLGAKRQRKRAKHFDSIDEDKENESPLKKLRRLWPKKLERWPPERQ
jgi:hypothetical protein